MSSTITPSEDKLYMTEDLEGRIDPDSLVSEPDGCPHYPPGQPVLQRSCIECAGAKESEKFYEENSFSLAFPAPPEPAPVNVTLTLNFSTLTSCVLEGALTSFSFGSDGWLCSMSIADALPVTSIVLQASKEKIESIRVTLPDGAFDMLTNVDCTVTFMSYGTVSFTATSDEARYV